MKLGNETDTVIRGEEEVTGKKGKKINERDLQQLFLYFSLCSASIHIADFITNFASVALYSYTSHCFL